MLTAVRGTGLKVAAGADATCRRRRTELIRDRLRQVLLEAHHSRLDGDALRTLVEEELDGLTAHELT